MSAQSSYSDNNPIIPQIGYTNSNKQSTLQSSERWESKLEPRRTKSTASLVHGVHSLAPYGGSKYYPPGSCWLWQIIVAVGLWTHYRL
eukprot:6180735-Pleurochrysis_carterae.AAC.1